LCQVPPSHGENFGEILALVKKLPCFDDPIELDVLLVGALHLGVHDLIKCRMFNASRIDFYRGQELDRVQSVQERWKTWSKKLHIKYRVQSKERGILDSKVFSPIDLVMV
jgi:hypothetical protein